jgi:hypothetical protein
MAKAPSGNWWSRNLWALVLFPVLAAVLLAGVSVFKGWLHQRAGFDEQGKPLQGAEPKLPPAKPRPALAAAEAYRHIVADLQRRDAELRPNLRYLSLVHRHNQSACSEAELNAERQAVRDLVDLLAQGKAARIDFIDPDQLLLRIDLEEFAWNTDTDWHKAVAGYRYGLSAGSPESLAKLRQQVEELTQEKIPVVRADWFVVALTRPPLSGPKGLLHASPSELSEGIRTLSRQYTNQMLDLDDCARELGLEDDKALTALIKGHESLQQEFGLAPLLKGERIRRDWWESERNFFSPYQEVARQLKLGRPVRVQ